MDGFGFVVRLFARYDFFRVMGMGSWGGDFVGWWVGAVVL